MPIKPIDLQTLFTQLDRVGRERAAEKEGAALQQSIQGSVDKQRAEEASRAVAKAQETQDNSEQKVAIREDETPERRRGKEDGGEKREKGKGDAEEEPGEGVIRDPRLGGNIDILG